MANFTLWINGETKAVSVEPDTPLTPEGAPASQQDSKRRLGNYGTPG